MKIRQYDQWSQYAYIYMHYPSIRALYNSAEAGCDLCKLLHGELQRNIVGDFIKATTACSPEPDDDTSIATELAEFTRPENIHRKALDCKHDKSKRIVLRHYSIEGTGPRGDPNPVNIEVLPVGDISGFATWIRGVKTSREFIVSDDILIPLGDTNTG